ncbi:MAG: cell division protein SepF [Selenomonadaceae bacterium]|nr:cell division protein SepF [Selenomonadaceae bacterium]
MVVLDWIRKITDIIMPMENVPDDEEVKETKKTETKEPEKITEKPVEAKSAEQFETPAQKNQPLMQNFQAEKQVASGGMGGFTRTRVSTSENGVTSVGGMRLEAYASEASVRPSLAVVKTPQVTMKIYSPTKYDEQVKAIGQDLIKRNSVVVNYEGMDASSQQRICDFVLGVVYTINGHVEMITNKIILYVPEGFEVESAQVAMAAKMRRYN